MRATWLTWRIHRFEILFVLAVAAALVVSAWVVADQIRSLGLTESLCWPRDEEGGYATARCDTLMGEFWPIASQAGYVRVALTVAPMLLGLVLGTPIVARELELRTAAFSWALTPSRSRWLLARFLPMLLVGLVGFAVAAWAGDVLFDALWLGRYGPDLTEIGGQGLALVARGFAAICVALLVGALLRRTMPAFLVSVVLMGVWSLFVVTQAQNVLAGERAVWQREDQDTWRTGVVMLTYVDYAFFDPSRPGEPGEPGLRIDEEAAWAATDAEVTATCGQPPDDDTGETPAYRTWSDCASPIWKAAQAHMVQATKAVPRSAWVDFVALDVAMSLGLGGVALLLTFPVVARRRPE